MLVVWNIFLAHVQDFATVCSQVVIDACREVQCAINRMRAKAALTALVRTYARDTISCFVHCFSISFLAAGQCGFSSHYSLGFLGLTGEAARSGGNLKLGNRAIIVVGAWLPAGHGNIRVRWPNGGRVGCMRVELGAPDVFVGAAILAKTVQFRAAFGTPQND